MKMKFGFRTILHYVLLTGAVFFIHYLTDIFGIEELVVNEIWYGWFVLFLFYAIGIFIADTILLMFIDE